MKGRKKTIFDVATELTPELIGEIIELSSRRHKTIETLHEIQGISKAGFVSAQAMRRAEAVAVNLPSEDLKRFLMTLRRSQIIQLLALLWLGRGDGPCRMTVEYSFLCLCDHASSTVCPDDLDYIIYKPLEDYLSTAIRMDPDMYLTDEMAI